MTNSTLPAEFEEWVGASIMDQIFNLGDDELKWRLWVTATSVSDRNWMRSIEMLITDGIDMETWIAAAVSFRKALSGELEWIVI